MADYIEDINNRIDARVERAVNQLKSSMDSLGIEHGSRDRLDKSLKTKTTKDRSIGMTNRIRFRFKKSGVFVHKGVGRGGSKNRTPKEWFNPVIEKVADDLAEIAADGMVELTFKRLKIN